MPNPSEIERQQESRSSGDLRDLVSKNVKCCEKCGRMVMDRECRQCYACQACPVMMVK